MRKHTPGPWHFLDWGGRIVDGAAGSSQILIATIALNTRGGDESRRNARLIAAAPEMLESLKELELFVRVLGLDSAPAASAAADARAAIAKAEGRE